MIAPPARMTFFLTFGFTCLAFASADSRGQEASVASRGESPTFSDQDLEFFESKVRPLLVQHCYECHGTDSDPKEGGFLASSRKAMLLGGDTGPAIKPGEPDSSLLVEVVNYDGDIAMPTIRNCRKNR